MSNPPDAPATLVARLRHLVEQWRMRADGVIEDVNNGDAPTHEADRAHGWQDASDELDAALAALGVPPQETLEETIRAILHGIDREECEDAGGWWETSAGAAFGRQKLEAVIAALRVPEGQ